MQYSYDVMAMACYDNLEEIVGSSGCSVHVVTPEERMRRAAEQLRGGDEVQHLSQDDADPSHKTLVCRLGGAMVLVQAFFSEEHRAYVFRVDPVWGSSRKGRQKLLESIKQAIRSVNEINSR